MHQSLLAYLSCHSSSSKSSESSVSNHQRHHHHHLIKIVISIIILPRSWKSPALLDEENSSCTNGCSVEWESPSKPVHSSAALPVRRRLSPITGKHELSELPVVLKSLRAYLSCKLENIKELQNWDALKTIKIHDVAEAKCSYINVDLAKHP